VEFVHYKTKIFSLTTAHGDKYFFLPFLLSICNMKARISCKKSLKKQKGVIRSRKSEKERQRGKQ
jgi:hypothetical protein